MRQCFRSKTTSSRRSVAARDARWRIRVSSRRLMSQQIDMTHSLRARAATIFSRRSVCQSYTRTIPPAAPDPPRRAAARRREKHPRLERGECSILRYVWRIDEICGSARYGVAELPRWTTQLVMATNYGVAAALPFGRLGVVRGNELTFARMPY